MRLRFWLSIALGALAATSAVAGCTMDFNQFDAKSGACGATEKRCGDRCVSALDPAFGCGEGCEPCDIPNALAVCSDGACAVDQCVAGFSDCDLDPASGCESNVTSDPLNCGGCGSTCTAINGTPGCNAGDCVIEGCNPGYDDCDMIASTGCETQTSIDHDNCGSCGIPCNPFQICQDGMCVLICDPGLADCDGDVSNGCETQLGDVSNCTACGDACTFPNATGVCTGPMTGCALGACASNFGDCDMSAANGCEVNLDTDVLHCGLCPTVCPFGPSSTPVCNSGVCDLLCTGDFRNCDDDPANGCEVNIMTDPASCGACYRACSSANASMLACVGGVCDPTCSPNYDDCSSPVSPMPDNGCEVHLPTHVDHCGACGRACATAGVASRNCAGGLCTSTCDLGLGNCSQPAAPTQDNGCETAVLANDHNNCGGCGNSCQLQGAANNPFECDQGGGSQQLCGCTGFAECDAGGNGAAQVSCLGDGRCACNGNTCNYGEACQDMAGFAMCSCNTLSPCGPGMTCCQTPSGCYDLATSPQSCGACGRACAPGFVCAGASCRCDAAADCDAGTGGAFTCDGVGRCVCGVTTCAIGERCQPNGQCG